MYDADAGYKSLQGLEFNDLGLRYNAKGSNQRNSLG